MPFSIAGPSYPALASLDGINRASDRFSSGQRIDFRNNAADAAIAGRLDTAIGESTVLIRNATIQISATQKGEQTLRQINSQIERIAALAVQAGNGTLSESDRQILGSQSSDLINQASSTLRNATFNGNPLFETTGIDVEKLQIKLDLLLDSGNPLDQKSIADIREGISSARAELGAEQNTVISQIESLENDRLIASNRRSDLSDTDFVEEFVNLLKEELQLKASIKVFNHRRLVAESIINLLLE